MVIFNEWIWSIMPFESMDVFQVGWWWFPIFRWRCGWTVGNDQTSIHLKLLENDDHENWWAHFLRGFEVPLRGGGVAWNSHEMSHEEQKYMGKNCILHTHLTFDGYPKNAMFERSCVFQSTILGYACKYACEIFAGEGGVFHSILLVHSHNQPWSSL